MGYTDNWNFTISRQLPWSSLFEIAYIGNRSRELPAEAMVEVWGLGVEASPPTTST